MAEEKISQSGPDTRDINTPLEYVSGGQTDIWAAWEQVKRNPLIRKTGRFVAHLCGIWTSRDLIDLGRKLSAAKGLRRMLVQIRYERLCLRLGVYIPSFDRIGEGIILPHCFGVVIDSHATIGKNCAIYKGVSIGTVRSGKRKGVPVLEDRVVVHANAVVAGGITIGHDTLIAGGSFVDFDVPPHSVVIGNPAVIHHKEFASKDYIT